MASLPRTSRNSRSIWICLDLTGTRLRYPLDCTDDILLLDCDGERMYSHFPGNDISNEPQYAIYQSSIDYQTAAYGPYAASATGGNDLARDFLAGVAAMYSTPLYKNIPGRPVQYASTILACLAFLVTIPIYIVYWKGPEIRAKSKFAQSLDKSRTERTEKRRKSSIVGVGEKEHRERV